MWSLPDLKRLNHQRLEKLEHAAQTGILDGRPLLCEYGVNGKNCRGPLSHQLWFDIYSDGPRGIVSFCEFHRTRFGRPENFFICRDCERWVTKTYVYTLPFEIDEDGFPVCLRCSARRYVASERNWISLQEEDIAVVTFDTVRRARHVVDVGLQGYCGLGPVAFGPTAETVAGEIQLFDRIPLDSETWGLISGIGCQDPTPDSAVEMIREILEEARDAGHDRALLIIDGVYQCAFTVGVYVWRVPAVIQTSQ